MKKSVLFITYWYPSKETPAVGIFVKEHAKAIASSGNNILVLHFDLKYGKHLIRYNLQKFNDEAGITVIQVQIYSLLWKAIYQLSPFFHFHLYKILKRNNTLTPSFDLVHSNVIFPAAFLGFKISQKYKVPHVITEHWSRLDHFLSKSLFRSYAHRILSGSAYLLPVSSLLSGIFKKHQLDSDKIKIVPNVVDETVFYYQEKEFTEQNHLEYTTIAGWYRKKSFFKRPDLLFQALDQFSIINNAQITLNVVGDGDLVKDLIKMSESLHFKANFHGAMTKFQINDLLKQTHFLLHASDFETFGIVVVEALKTGTPVIVSDIPALRQFVTEENGLLVRNDRESWLSALQEAYGKKWDYAEIAAQSRSLYSLSGIGKQIDEIYDKALMRI